MKSIAESKFTPAGFVVLYDIPGEPLGSDGSSRTDARFFETRQEAETFAQGRFIH